MRTINVDLDGVLYPFHEELWKYGYRKGYLQGDNEQAMNPVTKWEMWEDWGISHGEWKSIFRKGVEDDVIWRLGNAIPGSVSALWRLSDAGWNIRIVTHRLVHKFNHTDAIVATVDWLERHNVPFWDIVFLGKGDKADIFADAMVDDRPENLSQFALYAREGSAILYDQPWNRKLVSKYVTRLPNWYAIQERLLTLGEELDAITKSQSAKTVRFDTTEYPYRVAEPDSYNRITGAPKLSGYNFGNVSETFTKGTD